MAPGAICARALSNLRVNVLLWFDSVLAQKKENRNLARLDPSITDQLRVDKVNTAAGELLIGRPPYSRYQLYRRPSVYY